MEEYEEYEDDFRDEIAELIKDSKMKEELELIKLKLANENYQALVLKGLDIQTMNSMGVDLDPIHRTLKEMLNMFEDLEEYEKCAKVAEFIKQIENI
jgi:phosphate uptake regulator